MGVRAIKACMKDMAWELMQMEWCVVEWVKSNMLRWLGNMEKDVFVKKVHICE